MGLPARPRETFAAPPPRLRLVRPAPGLSPRRLAMAGRAKRAVLWSLALFAAVESGLACSVLARHPGRSDPEYWARLERIRELTGLDPMSSEDRERLGLGLKAYRIIAPKLPR